MLFGSTEMKKILTPLTSDNCTVMIRRVSQRTIQNQMMHSIDFLAFKMLCIGSLMHLTLI